MIEIGKSDGKSPSKEKELKITDINDDCLSEIFILLNSDDLIQLFGATSRFHNAIKRVLPKKDIKIDGEHLPNLERLYNFLKLFSGQIKNLNVENLWRPRDLQIIEEMLSKYCVDGNVSKYACRFGTMSNAFINTNSKFFESLHSLKLVCLPKDTRSRLNGFRSQNDLVHKFILKTTTTLVELHMQGIAFNLRDLLNILTAYEIETLKLILVTNTRQMKMKDVPVFESVTHLVIISTDKCDWAFASFRNVVNFAFSNVHCDLQPQLLDRILGFKMLKKLQLQLNSISRNEIESFLAKLPTDLETLHLELIGRSFNDEMIKNICRITNLTELCIGSCKHSFNTEYLQLAASLPKLRLFQFESRANATLPEVSIICDFIRLAKNLRLINFMTGDYPKECQFGNQLYDKVVEMCENEKRYSILNVHIVIPLYVCLTKHQFLHTCGWINMKISKDKTLLLQSDLRVDEI